MAAVAMATQQPRYMDGSEIRLARHWWEEDDVSVAEIARRLRRSPSSLWRLFGGEASASKGVGRKAKLTDLDKPLGEVGGRHGEESGHPVYCHRAVIDECMQRTCQILRARSGELARDLGIEGLRKCTAYRITVGLL